MINESTSACHLDPFRSISKGVTCWPHRTNSFTRCHTETNKSYQLQKSIPFNHAHDDDEFGGWRAKQRSFPLSESYYKRRKDRNRTDPIIHCKRVRLWLMIELDDTSKMLQNKVHAGWWVWSYPVCMCMWGETKAKQETLLHKAHSTGISRFLPSIFF